MTQQDNAFSDFPAETNDGKAVDKQTFEKQVNTATEKMTLDDKGNWVVPKDLPEEVAFAATLEKRRRDAQAELGREQTKAKKLQTSVDTLKQLAIDNAQLNLTVDQKEELVDLKATDPDAWKAKLEEYEQEAVDKVTGEVSELGYTGEAAVEEARRIELLQKCLDTNPGLVLDDEVFDNDLPPRLTSKLANDECTFEEFLEEAVKFLSLKTTIKDASIDNEQEPNLGKAGGGDSASEASVAQDSRDTYRNEIY